MNVNRIYGEEIAKLEGGREAKPFHVQWDLPESGAALKIVYRTPRLWGVIALVLGLTAIAFALYFGWRSFHSASDDAFIGFGIIFALGMFSTVCALRTGWTRMEYEFRRGVCTVRYSLAGLLRREWSFAYDDQTTVFMRRVLTGFISQTVPEYGFTDGEGNVLFRTKQAMRLAHFDYFALVTTAYLSRNEDEEVSKRVIANMRFERNLRDTSELKRFWIYVAGVICLIGVLFLLAQRRYGNTKKNRLAERLVLEAFCKAGDYKMVALEQKTHCGERAQKQIDVLVSFCDEYNAARQRLIESAELENTAARIEALQKLASQFRNQRERLFAYKGKQKQHTDFFAARYQMLEQFADRIIAGTREHPDCKMTVTIEDNAMSSIFSPCKTADVSGKPDKEQ